MFLTSPLIEQAIALIELRLRVKSGFFPNNGSEAIAIRFRVFVEYW